MATPSKTGKDLAQFNVKNAVYALEGTPSTVKPMTWMNTFSKDRNVATHAFYGDGEMIVSLASDRSVSGTIGATARDDDFEEDVGLAIAPDGGGTAEIAVKSMPRICFGFETDYIGADGIRKAKKTWVFGVQVSPPNDSFTQDQDDITQSAADYAYTAYGVDLLDAEGETAYVDGNGQKTKVFTWSKKPPDSGYAAFLDSVPVPKAAST